MKRRGLFFFILCILAANTFAADVSNIPEEARRYMIRGRTALEMARSPDDYRLAIDEFQQAVRLAPDWADAHYNLAAVQARAGDYRSAIASYRRYLELAPDAADAPKVRDEIVSLEYRLERKGRVDSLAGEWVDEALPARTYTLGFEGKALVAHTMLPEPKGIDVVYDMLGGAVSQDFFAKGSVTERFELQSDGNTLRGSYIRPAFVEEHSGCTIPEQRSPVEGRIDPVARRVELRYTRQKFLVHFTSILFFDQCSSVVPTANEEIRLSLVPRQKN